MIFNSTGNNLVSLLKIEHLRKVRDIKSEICAICARLNFYMPRSSWCMENRTRRIKNLVLVGLIGIAVATYYGYSKYDYARTISAEIESWPNLATEKVELDSVLKSEKNFTLKLYMTGVIQDSTNIAELNSHYDNVALNYVCSTSRFNNQFKEGYQISLDIKYKEESDKTFKQIYISKERCKEFGI